MFINKYFNPLYFRIIHETMYLTAEEKENIKNKELEKTLRKMLYE